MIYSMTTQTLKTNKISKTASYFQKIIGFGHEPLKFKEKLEFELFNPALINAIGMFIEY